MTVLHTCTWLHLAQKKPLSSEALELRIFSS